MAGVSAHTMAETGQSDHRGKRCGSRLRRFVMPRQPPALGRPLAIALALGLFLIAVTTALVAAGARPADAAPAARAAPRSSCGQPGPATNDGPASKTAHLTLNRTSGATGTLIDAGGSGWPAGDTVTLRMELADPGGPDYIDPNGPLASALVGPDGTFSGVQFRVPPGVCGDPAPPDSEARVVVQDTATATPITAYGPFHLVGSPQLMLDTPNNQVSSASSLTVTGTGWTPGTAIDVTFGMFVPTNGYRPTMPQSLPDAPHVQATADSSGSFSATVPLPTDLRPGNAVQAMASTTTPEYGDLALLSSTSAMVVPAQTPTLQLQHASGDATASINLSGSGWWPGDRLIIGACAYVPCSPDNQELVPLTTVQVDPAGAFQAQLPPPTQWGAGRVINLVVYPTPYDADTNPFYLQTTRYTILSSLPSSTPPRTTSWLPLSLHFDLGAVLGLVMLVAVAAIIAEPLARRRQRRAGPGAWDRADAGERNAEM